MLRSINLMYVGALVMWMFTYIHSTGGVSKPTVVIYHLSLDAITICIHFLYGTPFSGDVPGNGDINNYWGFPNCMVGFVLYKLNSRVL